MPYVAFSVSDGESRYQISERSLGFRWFFSFLLFTSFKQAAPKSTIFLFDEPAANLHAKAQAELLDNFAKIACGGVKIIYSTHSHHMINPRWLSMTYIIDNQAIDYEAQNGFDLDPRPTDIKSISYRAFVAQFPRRTTYFQPVLEKLDYVTPEMVGRSPYLIVEGITDYYALKYAQISAGRLERLSIMPGTGSGSSGPLLSYLMGTGERFLLLLDDDKSGKIAADRYKTNWLLGKNEILTLGELLNKHEGKKLETLLSEVTLLNIAKSMGLEGAPSKKQVGLFLSEMCASNSKSALSSETLSTLLEIIDAVTATIKT